MAWPPSPISLANIISTTFRFSDILHFFCFLTKFEIANWQSKYSSQFICKNKSHYARVHNLSFALQSDNICIPQVHHFPSTPSNTSLYLSNLSYILFPLVCFCLFPFFFWKHGWSSFRKLHFWTRGSLLLNWISYFYVVYTNSCRLFRWYIEWVRWFGKIHFLLFWCHPWKFASGNCEERLTPTFSQQSVLELKKEAPRNPRIYLWLIVRDCCCITLQMHAGRPRLWST